MMAAPSEGGGGDEGGGNVFSRAYDRFTGDDKKKSSGGTDPKLLKSLANINRTMANLPSMISSIELEVKPNA